MQVVTNNILSQFTSRQLKITTGQKAKSAEKLSTGYKINRSADDAAGLAISEKMRWQIRGLSQGEENTQDGSSLCQVADGALAEVSDMLHRLTELSVQAANDTNTAEDREAIQREINEILREIDNIGDNTQFNSKPVFKGTDKVIKNADGTSASFGNLAFSDFKLADVNLGQEPLVNGENADMLHLQAIVDNSASALNGKTFNLIYGNGSTSNSSLRITDTAGNQTIVRMDQLICTGFTSDSSTGACSKTFEYTGGNGVSVSITQSIKLENTSAEEKKYNISYEFSGTDVANLEFMFHVDTAYNNNDRCEGYFVNGNRIENDCVYNTGATNDSQLTANSSSSYIKDGSSLDSLSIVDVDNALPFSEKISFGTDKPDSISIGVYSQIDDWSYYDSLDTNLGGSTNRKDLGFSLYYDLGDLTQGTQTASFYYGIVSTQTDNNLTNVSVNIDKSEALEHFDELSLWIQSGATEQSGMFLTIGEMNTNVLGIDRLDVSSFESAGDALNRIENALEKLSTNRSNIGAQQNRLEHMAQISANTAENTAAAESRIRDTDMAKEMVEHSKYSILEQAGLSVLAQANQSKQGILTLLQ